MQELVSHAQTLFGDDLFDAYLVGSFAVGDPDIHSDCDFLIVVRRPVTAEQESALRALHRALPARDGHLNRHLEARTRSSTTSGRSTASGGNGSTPILADVADDVDWAAEAASTTVPWYGTYRGKAEVPRFFKEIGSNLAVTEFTLVSSRPTRPTRWSSSTGRTR